MTEQQNQTHQFVADVKVRWRRGETPSVLLNGQEMALMIEADGLSIDLRRDDPFRDVPLVTMTFAADIDLDIDAETRAMLGLPRLADR